MKKQKIYLETFRHGLVPCEFLGWTKTPLGIGEHNATVRLKCDSKSGYERGDIVRVPARVIVVKAGQKDYYQMVKPAILPVRTVDNTLPDVEY